MGRTLGWPIADGYGSSALPPGHSQAALRNLLPVGPASAPGDESRRLATRDRAPETRARSATSTSSSPPPSSFSVSSSSALVSAIAGRRARPPAGSSSPYCRSLVATHVAESAPGERRRRPHGGLSRAMANVRGGVAAAVLEVSRTKGGAAPSRAVPETSGSAGGASMDISRLR